MKEIFRLIVPGEPVAQPRQRHAAVNGRPINYTPRSHPVQTWKATIRLAAQAEMQRLGLTILEGPLMLQAWLFFSRPQRLQTKKAPDGAVPHLARPDSENVLKAVQDALTGVLYRDDSQLYDVRCSKWYAEKGGAPRLELVVWGEG